MESEIVEYAALGVLILWTSWLECYLYWLIRRIVDSCMISSFSTCCLSHAGLPSIAVQLKASLVWTSLLA